MSAKWSAKRLKYGARLNPPVPARIRSLTDEPLSFIPMEAIGEDWSLDTSRQRPAEDLFGGYSYFEDGDLLMAKVTPCFENGKVTVARGLTRGSGFGTTEVTVVRATEFHPQFLFYVLNEDGFRQRCVADMTGAGGLKRVPDSSVRDYRVLFPSLESQGVIADFLDRETGEIDSFIRDQEELIGLLQERRAATISHTVTKGLDPNTPLQDSGVKWLGLVPASWRTRPLWSMFRKIKDTGHPGEVMLSVYREHGVVEKGSLENLNKTAENRDIYQLIEPGWLVANRMKAWQGSVGISQYRGIVSGHYICFAPRHQESSDFLNLLFRSRPYAAGYATLSRGVRIGQAEIDNDQYRLLPVLLPPLSEQHRIVRVLAEELTDIDAAITDARGAIVLSAERRSALISAAVTGRIDVRERLGV
jgi:type I restriction enzyme S subunit